MKNKMKSDKKSIIWNCVSRLKTFNIMRLKCELAKENLFLSNQEIYAVLKKYVSDGKLKIVRGWYYRFS